MNFFEVIGSLYDVTNHFYDVICDVDRFQT